MQFTSENKRMVWSNGVDEWLMPIEWPIECFCWPIKQNRFMGERKVPHNQRLGGQGKCLFNELAPLRRSERQYGKTVNSRSPFNEVKLDPVTFLCSNSRKQMISLAVKPVFAHYFLLVFLLHLHEIVEGLYFHCSLSVCVCVSVCLSVCVSGWILVNKIPAERMNRFWCGFR